MKKMMRLLVTILIIPFFLVGCESNETSQSNSTNDNENTQQEKMDNSQKRPIETADTTEYKEKVNTKVTTSTKEVEGKNEPQKQTKTKEATVTKPKQQSEPVVTNQTQEKEKPKKVAANNQSNVTTTKQIVNQQTKSNTPVNEVTISIKADAETGFILKATKVSIEDGDTVLEVLKKVTKQNHIQMEYSGGGATAYIEGIQNLYEFDKGPKSGWMYSINGAFMKKGAGTTEVKPGDKIEWAYTLDLGKDLGAIVNE